MHALILQNNAVGAVCPCVIVTLYFDSHSSLPAHFAPQQSAHPQVLSWRFLPSFFSCPTLNSSFSPSKSQIPSILQFKFQALLLPSLNGCKTSSTCFTTFELSGTAYYLTSIKRHIIMHMCTHFLVLQIYLL